MATEIVTAKFHEVSRPSHSVEKTRGRKTATREMVIEMNGETHLSSAIDCGLHRVFSHFKVACDVSRS